MFKLNYLFLLMFVGTTNAATEPYFDSFPLEMAKRISEQQSLEKSAAKKLDVNAAHYILSKRRWNPGSKVLVAFNGGMPELHKFIADNAKKWMKYANVELDFGYDQKTKTYRKWSNNDRSYAAHIRIGFSEKGYWSYIGTDSISDDVPPNKASMNFEGFDRGWPNLKEPRWEQVIIHEAGHSLGLHHEHQQPVCKNEFRWKQGVSGEPDVYNVFKGWLGWDKDLVDINLSPVGEKTNSSTNADRKSIMFYAMPEQAFVKGSKSPCFIPKENTVISQIDQLAMRIAYPKNSTNAVNAIKEYQNALNRITIASRANLTANSREKLTSKESDAIKTRVETSIDASKPILYVHIQRESDRDEAKKITEALQSAGFMTPDIENVSKKGLKSGKLLQIRYFRNMDSDSADVALNTLVENLGRKDVEILHVSGFESKVTKNIIEIWFP